MSSLTDQSRDMSECVYNSPSGTVVEDSYGWSLGRGLRRDGAGVDGR